MTRLPVWAEVAVRAAWAWQLYRYDMAPVEDVLVAEGNDARWALAVEGVERAIYRSIEDAVAQSHIEPAFAVSDLLDRFAGVDASDRTAVETIVLGFLKVFDRLETQYQRLFDSLFLSVLNTSCVWYESVGVPVQRASLIGGTAFSTPWSKDIDRLSPIREVFHAVALVEIGCTLDDCCISTEEVSHWQSLTLTIYPRHLNQATVSAMPFALFHEAVSHLLQGPHEDSRPTPARDSQFAEGSIEPSCVGSLSGVCERRSKIKDVRRPCTSS